MNPELRTIKPISSAPASSSSALHLLVLATLAVRLLTMPGFVESGDGLYFVRGVTRYAMLELRPHRPGFPVYIWLGQFFRLFSPDSAQALHLLAVLCSALTIWPIAGLAGSWRRYSGGSPAAVQQARFAAGLLWALVPLSWLGGSEIYSDPVALLLGLLSLWCAGLSLEKPLQAQGWLSAAAGLGGLTIGVRMTYALLLLPLLYAAYLAVKKPRLGAIFRAWWRPGLAFVGSVGVWVGWQVWQEGPGIFPVILNRVAGDYRMLGVAADYPDPTRYNPSLFYNLATLPRTLLVYGLGGWWPGVSELWRLPVTLVLAALLLVGLRRLVSRPARPALWTAWLFGLPYLLVSVLVSHDVNMARYTFPLVALLCIIMGLGSFELKLSLAKLKPASFSLPVFYFSLLLFLVTGPLAWQHRLNPPLGERLATYARSELDPAKSTLLIPTTMHRDAFLNLFMHERAGTIPSLSVIPSDVAAWVQYLQGQGRTVYLIAQPARPPSAAEGWQPVAALRQPLYLDSLMDANDFREIWIYELVHGS